MMNYLKKHRFTLLLVVFVLAPNIIHAADLLSIGGFAFDLIGGLLSPIAVGIVKLVSYITMLSGVVLNASVYYTVVNMADSLSPEKLPAINTAWSTVRDLANMGFIFMLLYASIMTIVGKEKNARDIVVKMVIAAILINFSLFFTKVIIDIANLLALTFYNVLAPGAGTDFLKAGLSNNIIQALGAQTLWQSAGELDGSTVFISAIMSSITLLVTAFVFAAMAVMFLVRYIVLIFVLILSPLMVLSSVFPAISEYSKKWWSALLNQAFFAPVFFILMWVTLTLITGISQSIFGSTSSLSGALNASSFNADGVSIIINYAVILGFVVVTLVISKSIADKASPLAANLNKWAVGKAGGATLGLAGGLGRGTIGRAGQAVADSEYLKKKAPTSRLARLALATGQKTGGASFDVRGSAIGGELGAGKAQSGGFAKDMKDRREAEKKIAESFKPSDLVINQAEKELEEAKKTGDQERIDKAQTDLDNLKGADDAEMRKRAILQRRKETGEDEKKAKDWLKEQEKLRFNRIQDIIKEAKAAGKTITEKEAKEQAKKENVGWAPEEIKSASKERQEAYAKELEKSNIEVPDIPGLNMLNKKIGPSGISMDRIAFVGPVKKEVKFSAIDIRKKLKEKKPEEKLAEELKNAKESGADDAGGKEAKKNGGESGGGESAPKEGGKPGGPFE